METTAKDLVLELVTGKENIITSKLRELGEYRDRYAYVTDFVEIKSWTEEDCLEILKELIPDDNVSICPWCALNSYDCTECKYGKRNGGCNTDLNSNFHRIQKLFRKNGIGFTESFSEFAEEWKIKAKKFLKELDNKEIKFEHGRIYLVEFENFSSEYKYCRKLIMINLYSGPEPCIFYVGEKDYNSWDYLAKDLKWTDYRITRIIADVTQEVFDSPIKDIREKYGVNLLP